MTRARHVPKLAALGCLLAAAGLAAGALFGQASTVDGAALARALDARVGEVTTALHARLATLAELPRLAAAVSTDAATVRDLTVDELAFRPRPGETIAIAQRSKRDKRPPTVLLLAPPDGEAPVLETGGPRARITRGALRISEALAVAPRERADEIEGIVAASAMVDLADFVAALAKAGAAAELQAGAGTGTGEGRLVLGDPAVIASAKGSRIDLGVRTGNLAGQVGDRTGDPAAGPRLVLIALAGREVWVWWVAVGIFGVAALAFGIAARRPPGAVRRPADDGWRGGPSVSGPVSGPVSSPVSGTRVYPEGPSGGGHAPSPSSPVASPSLASSAPPAAPSPSPSPSLPSGSAASASPSPAQPGWKVGRYEIVRRLGAGGMAEVFLARATGEAGFSKLIALKLLQPALAGQQLVVGHFLDEARLASHLDHPNIVQTLDLGRAAEGYFIAMEYIDGADLERVIALERAQGRRIPVPVALAILRKVCDGLHAAHTSHTPEGQPLGLVHRDVKSANVFVSRKGLVKVGDFGIAKIHDASRVSRTEIGMIKGTPGYMAPEHRLGQPLDARADLYGVGAIAYELLSGAPVNLDLIVLAAKGTDGWPHLAPLASFRDDLPPDLQAAISKALSYEREDRFADCAAFEAALEQIANHLPLAGEKVIARWIETALVGADSAGGSTLLLPNGGDQGNVA